MQEEEEKPLAITTSHRGKKCTKHFLLPFGGPRMRTATPMSPPAILHDFKETAPWWQIVIESQPFLSGP